MMHFIPISLFVINAICLTNARRIPFVKVLSYPEKEESLNKVPETTAEGSRLNFPEKVGNAVDEYSYFDEDFPFEPMRTNDNDVKPPHRTDVVDNEYEVDSKEIGNENVPEIMDTNSNDDNGEKVNENAAGDDTNEYEENLPIHSGFFLDSPFFNLEQMTRYLKQLERALDQVFKQTAEEAALLDGTFANTTEEEVDINGQKYKVQKSIIKTGDNNSSIFIEAIESVAKTNRKKRSNWFSENSHKDKKTDP